MVETHQKWNCFILLFSVFCLDFFYPLLVIIEGLLELSCPHTPPVSPAYQTAGNQPWFSKQALNQWCSEASNTGQSKPITFKELSPTSTPLVQPLGYDIREDGPRWREGLTKTQQDHILIIDRPEFTVDVKLGAFKRCLTSPNKELLTEPHGSFPSYMRNEPSQSRCCDNRINW